MNTTTLHTTDYRASGQAPTRTIVLWLIIALTLAVPSQLGFAYLYSAPPAWKVLVANIGMIGLLYSSSWLIRWFRKTWVAIVGTLIVAAFFVHMLFFGVSLFSGQAFNDGFFLSLQGESLALAWNQYMWLFVVLLLGTGWLCTALILQSRRILPPRGKSAALVGLMSLTFLIWGNQYTPTRQLADGASNWFASPHVTVPVSRLHAWSTSPLIHLHPTLKKNLKAAAATPAKNLILLYIESGGVAMAPAKAYPHLTPNLSGLISKHAFVPHLHASSYITIEGLVNSQCGTLIPFAHGNHSVGGFGHTVEKMTCLGDVLARAGYRQTFMQGADRKFAGTGQFLALHGYDRIMGFEDWQKMGLHSDPDTWGLSDPELFKQSLKELKKLRASGHPYNLTLFTLGSHIPGYIYRGCPTYGDGSKRYLNAVYCSDAMIGQWIDTLKSRGWLDDNTILVITADHQIFRNRQMTTLFGRKATRNSRLPFIVIGHHLPAAVEHDGAGYDIAPTIVDLLGIRTNAKFVLGRSLLRPSRKMPYYMSRYTDMIGENRYRPKNNPDCKTESNGNANGLQRVPGAQPLSSCERKELSIILQKQAVRYSSRLIETSVATQ